LEKIRGFEIVTKYKEKGVRLPQRATAGSAGYDFEAAEDTLVPSLWRALFTGLTPDTLEKGEPLPFVEENQTHLASTLVPTGIKAYMPEGEYLLLANRSSNPMKNQLALPNGVGIIDADYYNNDKNEGEIFLQLINYGLEDRLIKKGQRICQGIFMPYLTTDKEAVLGEKRTGGFGSSGV